MKVAFLLPSDRISGGVLVVLEHAARLGGFGIDCDVVFQNELPDSVAKATSEIKVKTLSLPEAQKKRYEVVVATWWETAFAAYSIPAEAYAYFVQSDERRFYSDWNPAAAELVELTYRWPFHFITEAEWIKQMLKREFSVSAGYAPNKLCHKTFFSDSNPVAQRGSRLRVLVEGPGGLPFKRVAQAIQAANQVSDTELWYVATDGVVKPEWRIDKVFGTQTRAELRRIYSSCDVLLKLSTVEGFFCPPLEMMACGGTAIVSAVSGHEEYVRDGVNALVVPLDDSAAAVQALTKLRDDRRLLQRLVQGGLETARAMQWEDSTAQFAEFLKECLKTTSNAAHPTPRELALFKGFNALVSGVFFPHEARARFSDTFSRNEAVSALGSIDTQLKAQNARVSELCSRVESLEAGIFARIKRLFLRMNTAGN